MELYLCCTNDTDILTSDHKIVTLPAGYTPCKIELTSQYQDERSDVLQLTKEIVLDGNIYISETKFSGTDLLNCITNDLCLTRNVFDAIPCIHKSNLKYLINNISLFSDKRDISWFALQLEANSKPVLCMIQHKYYSASLDIALSFGPNGKTSTIYGILRSNVPIKTSDNTIVAVDEPIYFKIPDKTLLWNNSIVLTEENGEEYFANNGIPLLSVWNKK